MAPEQFQMSKKDGKTVLLRSTEKKGFFTLKSHDDSIFEACENAQKACPVKIISTKKIWAYLHNFCNDKGTPAYIYKVCNFGLLLCLGKRFLDRGEYNSLNAILSCFFL